ncbi:M50 family metallopeptidase [Longispora sp. NPDC051575]|uniref:M50 family metallopeptidase n=1 Tax=Longispora sp. NPDC051575 TaxID=3154943 RepID=UPI00342B8A68
MLSALWSRLVEAQPSPTLVLIMAAAFVAAIAVVPAQTWRLTRGFVTIAHEGGHALVAVLSGRRLSGIRLHSDSSGLTLTRGKPTGLGMILTALAGYVTPSLLGLGGAALLAGGRSTAVLWTSLLLLPCILIMIRNFYGILSVLVTMGIVFAVSWFGSPDVRAVFCYLLVWFLLLGGVRPVFELQAMRRRGRAPDSDADQLARLTRVPGLVWVGFFLVGTVGALVLGGSWLIA